ncbi:hypothetical protein phiPsal1_020 [Pontimonas phage phiPsal1]|nr:hypothetical protein phiPsal1_020 [Pontimonas phage phiPsal1]
MAGLGRKVFTAGEVLDASEVNGYLMDQTIMVFASTSARTAAIGTPSEGMHTYISDTNQFQYWDGATWQDQGGAGGGLDNALMLMGG